MLNKKVCPISELFQGYAPRQLSGDQIVANIKTQSAAPISTIGGEEGFKYPALRLLIHAHSSIPIIKGELRIRGLSDPDSDISRIRPVIAVHD